MWRWRLRKRKKKKKDERQAAAVEGGEDQDQERRLKGPGVMVEGEEEEERDGRTESPPSALAADPAEDSGAEDLSSALSTNRSLTVLNLGGNKLGDSGVKLLSAALRNPDCKIQELCLADVGLIDSCIEDLASALRTNRSLTDLSLGSNFFTDRSVPALRSVILTCRSLEWIWLWGNKFSSNAKNQLKSLQDTRPRLSVEV
ncbi:NACHT, LRR and PYD domains-containing protein 3-like [Heptranchias perlo]|uniref:NACHT, LRR and PYD domains-containing protein 3-like n=1 Tax=Heptranchias perlo TaxID=212740 RepID=UPI00355968D6